jgi:hypothetical protein
MDTDEKPKAEIRRQNPFTEGNGGGFECGVRSASNGKPLTLTLSPPDGARESVGGAPTDARGARALPNSQSAIRNSPSGYFVEASNRSIFCCSLASAASIAAMRASFSFASASSFWFKP